MIWHGTAWAMSKRRPESALNKPERRFIVKKITTRKMVIDAMLAAVCAVLGYVAIDAGSFKVTFESLPVIFGALLLGPVDGLLIGGVGTFVYQILKYGFSPTTVLWMLPYMVCGLLAGAYSKKHDFKCTKKQIWFIVIISEVIILILNTGVMYLDAKIFGYYSAAYVFGNTAVRVAMCFAKGVVFSLIIPLILKPVRKAVILKER